MSRPTDDAHEVALAQRDDDMLALATLIYHLETGVIARTERSQHQEQAAALRRFIANDYPLPRRSRPPQNRRRNLWIALAYVLRVETLKENGTAVEVDLVRKLKGWGVFLSGSRIRGIVKEQRSREEFQWLHWWLTTDLLDRETGQPSTARALEVIESQLVLLSGWLTKSIIQGKFVR